MIIIAIAGFYEDLLYYQCKALTTDQGVELNTEYDKGKDKPPVWNDSIFKYWVFLNQFYAWIKLKNNSKGVGINCLDILMDTFMDLSGGAIEGPNCTEDEW